MDEELHRVLIFLMEILNKFPGWTHQAMLKQELLNAPIEGTLHRVLGSSPIETFTEFLKCFPTIFCINSSNQLVQLYMKNGSVSDVPGLPIIDAAGGGPMMKMQEEGRGLPPLGVMPVGPRKPPDPQHLDWNPSPMSVVPERAKMGFMGHEHHPQHQQQGTMCGIPSSYPGTSGLGPRSSWDTVAPPPLPDLQQSFLSSEPSRVRSASHLANGWDCSAPPNASHNCQPRFPDSSSDSRLPLNHRYTWDTSPQHSITDSLKNFSISDSSYSVGSSETTRRWPLYTSLSSDGLEVYANHGGSGDGRFVRPMTSVWDEPLRPRTPASQPHVPPQQGFLSQGAGDCGGLASHTSFKWEDPMPTSVSESSSALGFSSFTMAAKQQQQQPPPPPQYYEWKSPSPVATTETGNFSSPEPPLLPESSPEPTLEVAENLVVSLMSPPLLAMSPEIPVMAPPVPPLAIEEVVPESSTQALETSPTAVVSSSVAESSTTAMTPKQGAMLSYAEALRSNTQRRKVGSESSTGSANCIPASHVATVPPNSLKLAVNNVASGDRQPKSRRSLDGRCGKVEVLNAGDGLLRLGNGKVHFEKGIFYDSGKQVSDLRNVLKPNDTVYFDATLDGSGNHEWKATLAWVGKKPRSASASSPTTSAPSGRGYRLSENHSNATSNNGISSRVASSNNKATKDSVSAAEVTVEGTGEVVILFAHFGFIRRGKKFKENVHFNRNVFYASGNRVKELTDILKEGSMVNYVAVPSDKKSCKWKAVLVWTGTRPKV